MQTNIEKKSKTKKLQNCEPCNTWITFCLGNTLTDMKTHPKEVIHVKPKLVQLVMSV